MATAIVEQISAKVSSRCALITTGNGYENTVSSVVRPKRIDDTAVSDYRITVTLEDCQANEEMSTHGNPPAKGWEAAFRIAGILRPSETLSTAADTLRNQFWGDVVKALGVPTTGDWAQWDGLAIDSNIGSVEPYTSSDGESSGFSVMLNVLFRTDENNPFVVRA